jgi:hypothetical protein
MKLKLTRSVVYPCIVLSLLIQSSVSFAGSTSIDDQKEKKEEKKETKAKVSSSRNNSSVKIYPDIFKRVMHVVAKDSEATIDFFVFDLEGVIVKHYKMKSGDHQKITDLARAKYVFSVFSGDEQTATGNFEIR